MLFTIIVSRKSGIGPIQEFPCQDFPTRFAGSVRNFDLGNYLDKKQARRVDPFIRYTVVAGKKALEMGDLRADQLQRSRQDALRSYRSDRAWVG